MEEFIRRRYDALVQILAFVMAHLEMFSATALGMRTVAALQRLVAQMQTLSTTDAGARDESREHRVERARVRRALLSSGRALRRSSQLLAMAGVSNEERFPGFGSVSDRQLLSDARAALEKALALKPVFAEHQVDTSFLDAMPAQIETLAKAMERQSTGRETHVATKRVARDAISEMRPIVKTLELILLNVPNVDPLLVEEWKNAKRIGPARVRETAQSTEPPGTPSGTKVA